MLGLCKKLKKHIDLIIKFCYKPLFLFLKPSVILQKNDAIWCQKLDDLEKMTDQQENLTLFEAAKLALNPSVELKRRLIGCTYRNGKKQERVASEQMDLLLDCANAWIERQECIQKRSRSELRSILHEAGNYPDFIDFLLKEWEVQNAFFSWVIRDRISSSIFIKYPGIQKKIVDSNLNIRVNHFKKSGLKLKGLEVTMLIEGKEVNILDGNNKVVLRGNWELSVNQIFEIFKAKTYFCGHLEYTEQGVINWNVFEWGYWDSDEKKLISVEFEKENWWHDLPIFQTMTREEAAKELRHPLNGTNWSVAACATRGQKNLHLFENHAFMKVFFPSSDGLGYSVLPLGKYAKGIPLTLSPLEGFSALCSMTPATVSFIDENIFYSFREKAQYAFSMPPEQGNQLFNSIKKDLFRGKEGNFVYQIETENCAKWVHEILEGVLGDEKIPNLFKTKFLNTQATGVLGWVIKVLRKVPKCVQAWLVTRLHIPLGAFKGRTIDVDGKEEWVSVMTSSFWKTADIYFPAFLHHQIQKGYLCVKTIQKIVLNGIMFLTAVRDTGEYNCLSTKFTLRDHDARRRDSGTSTS